jgi:PAS domain S-box-containing protein
VLARGYSDVYDKEFVASDGSLVPVNLRVWLIRDEDARPVGMWSYIRDLRAQKRREEQYRTILTTAMDGFWIVDEDRRIRDVNDAYCRMSGYSRDELLGMRLDDLDAAWSAPDLEAHWRHALGDDATRFLSRHRRQNGIVMDVELSVSAIPSDSRRHFVFIRDVSDQLRAQQELGRRAEELARSNAELQQFAYIASHDLQEPLRMVSSYVELLARRYGPDLDDDAREFIGFATDGARRMQSLIDDILRLSRLGTQSRPAGGVDLNDVVATALKNLEVSLDESGAEVVVDPLPRIAADAGQLVQVFQNLIGNAIKFRGETAPRVVVSASRQDDGWVFVVRDNGIGIEPDYFDRIFHVFQRLHRRDAYPGTGIGLAICKKVVEGHGGRIWVESAPGCGSVFSFSIPDQNASVRAA